MKYHKYMTAHDIYFLHGDVNLVKNNNIAFYTKSVIQKVDLHIFFGPDYNLCIMHYV